MKLVIRRETLTSTDRLGHVTHEKIRFDSDTIASLQRCRLSVLPTQEAFVRDVDNAIAKHNVNAVAFKVLPDAIAKLVGIGIVEQSVTCMDQGDNRLRMEMLYFCS